jgi:GNAT superfamily N-acetyltransferase
MPAASRVENAFAIVPIAGDTLDQVAALLWERSRTLPAYTEWKYSRDGSPFNGVAALDLSDASVVGCFGLIARDLELPGGEHRRCGWFADWYVKPSHRKTGVGRKLLRALSTQADVVFGHPSPAAARSICDEVGYRALAFQSRRRLVLRPFAYERVRTRFAATAAARSLTTRVRQQQERKLYATVFERTQPAEAKHRLLADDAYYRWVWSQPVAPQLARTVATWSSDRLSVTYADDLLGTGESRCRVYRATGSAWTDHEAWRAFANQTRLRGCTHIDLFTTSPALDAAWRRLGAWSIEEAPVIALGLAHGGDEGADVLLQGDDRENWTYLATC